jgi:2-polyprenyl-3-methyl-5-hydroxy-6-metoxy-1,4-benzoquinol methylase
LNEFDHKALDWERDPMKAKRALAAGRAIAQAVPVAGKRVLDYGCGTGLLGFTLLAQAAHVTLADSSPGMLEVLRGKITASGAANLTPLRLDLQVDPLPEARFDLVCSLMVLHHIPDTRAILKKFHALLEPGGWLALLDLDQEDGSFHEPGVDVHPGFDRSAFQADLEAVGFSQIKFSTANVIQREPERGGGRYPVFLATGRKS